MSDETKMQVKQSNVKHFDYWRNYPKKTKREKANIYHKYWHKKHPEKVREYGKRQYIKDRRVDLFRLNNSMSRGILYSIHKNKNGQHWETLVGYTLKNLHAHLKSKFTDGMSWKNYGEWHIDHIIPISRFHFKTAEDAEFKVCWGLANLQPLWAKDNRSKHDKTMEEWQKSKEIRKIA
jgi:hypothetical protein